ncbi:hypothetical protein C1H46_017663 [Malus baccata]|uniref:Uncharacterized protein n=1 Tax=Malus baccata TaxID=106549 RepID=A0A540MDE5_MALBA|nr:hypothetical protein C1H46_017663 [Malus baccata]
MKVVPRKAEKLNLNNAGFLAQKRLARGLRFNHREAAVLIATQETFLFSVWVGRFWSLFEMDKSVAELMDIGRQLLGSLAPGAADFGLVNSAGQSASVIAESARWALGFQQAVVEVIRSGEIAQSSDASIFSPLMFVTQANNVEALKKLIEGQMLISMSKMKRDAQLP